jgi:formiminotetrahydrofolate cyclodeaminase
MSDSTTSETGERPIRQWLEALASDEPTPGGGSFAGLSAAAGASLIAMVARLTVGRKAYEDQESRMRELASRADDARSTFLDLADRDAAAFEAVMRAFRLPKNDETERAARAEAIQAGFQAAATIPMDVAELAVELMPLAREAIARGNPNAASDGYSAAVALHGAVLCAVANVRINAASLKDNATRGALLDRAERLRERAADQLDETEAAFGVRLQV